MAQPMTSIYLLCLILPLACMEPDTAVDQMDDKTDGPDEEQTEEDTTMDQNSGITFLALGDSYTIGESVPEDMRWPVQLASGLQSMDIAMEAPRIIARTGWTTNELQAAIDAEEITDTYGLVSLLIGVNNQYRGYPIDQYEREFEALLKQAVSFAGGDVARVFVVSIPDYGVTPFGQNGNPEKIASELDEYNAIAKGYCDALNVQFFNITPISREASSNTSYIAGDGLHPSGEMYAAWVQMILPWAADILDE